MSEKNKTVAHCNHLANSMKANIFRIHLWFHLIEGRIIWTHHLYT